MQTSLSFDGAFVPAQEKTYVHVPFDMPEGAVRVDVALSYSNKIHSDPLISGGNTVDLGIFDERGIDFLRAGFRGWTGSERLTFYIGETDATPGYLAGPLLPGRWHVLLGLYKIGPGGCTYSLTVTITTEPGHKPAGVAPKRISNLPSSPPPARSAPWLCGELHCHTWHSDGDSSPADVIALARERGLDFLAISDHNSTACLRELAGVHDPGLILIPGVEVTTFKGHFNVWGGGEWVDFRVQKPEDMVAAIDFAHQGGAVVSCAHPKPYGPPWDYTDVAGYDCIEVWNGPWPALNQLSLDFWVKQIAASRRIPAIAGSDWHRHSELVDDEPRAPGTPTVWVYVAEEPSAAAILSAIRQGHIALSQNPHEPLLDLRAGAISAVMGGDAIARPASGILPLRVTCRRAAGYRLLLLDQEKMLLEQVVDESELVTVDLPVPGSLYVRAELRAEDDEVKALSNPVYLE